MHLKYLTPMLAAAALALGAQASAGRLAPLAPSDAVSTHGPFAMGACDVCHDAKDRSRRPGRVLKASNDLCYDCHDEFKKRVKNHPAPPALQASKGACISCHSPHNALKKKLLL